MWPHCLLLPRMHAKNMNTTSHRAFSLRHVTCWALLVICCLLQSTHGNDYSTTTLLSSFPMLSKPGESKVRRRSPLKVGFVVGLGHPSASSSLATIHTSATSPSISPSLAHTLVAHHVAPAVVVKHSKYVAHDLSVTHLTPPVHSLGRDLNHGPATIHALVPTITHVTTTTVSEHGVTKSPTVTLVDHSLIPVDALETHTKALVGSGVSKQSRVSVTPECKLTKTDITVEHPPPATIVHAAPAAIVHPVDHTVIHKVSTLTHHPIPVITHEVSVTHISPPRNVFRTHVGGFGVGVDFGGHGSGHGFFV